MNLNHSGHAALMLSVISMVPFLMMGPSSDRTGRPGIEIEIGDSESRPRVAKPRSQLQDCMVPATDQPFTLICKPLGNPHGLRALSRLVACKRLWSS